MSEIAPDRTVGMRLKIAPSSDAVTDPWWIIITEITDEGVEFSDDDGLVESMDTETWQNELEPRVLEVELPQAAEDVPPEPVEEDHGEQLVDVDNDGHVTPANPPEPAPAAASEYAASVAPPATSLATESDLDAHKRKLILPDPVPSADTPRPTTLEALGICLNLVDELRAEIRVREDALAKATDLRDRLLKEIAKQQLLADEIPFGKLTLPEGIVAMCPSHLVSLVDATCPKCEAERHGTTTAPDPMATALGEEIEARNPSEPDPEPPTPQETALAEQVGAAEANEGYATVSRLEMNRRLIEVVGITKGQSERMAEQGVKTLGQFQQRFEETQDGKHNWYDGMKFISAEKADKIEECIETHWVKFKAKYGRK